MVTLEETKTHLRVEHYDEDEYIATLLQAARAIAEDFCLTTFEGPLPPPVRFAILLYVSHVYTYRENGNKVAFDTMMRAFHALLWPYRDTQKLF